MGVAGDKCVRCGRRSIHGTGRGLPTCSRCLAELRAEGEATLRCPHDGSDLFKKVIHDVVIDHCVECGGVWLDAGELRLIQQAEAAERTLQEFMASIPIGSA